ncbi:MAG TPA: hypothetical protein VHC69_21540 [Polyangiaceae bacterium]|nr:hypothetical protein [Polyangiaceae bacterium]
MKLVAVFASLVLHVAGLLAIPTNPREEPGTTADRSAVAVNAPSCKCDLEIGVNDCSARATSR